MFHKSVFSVISLLFFASLSYADECRVTKAAFDVGSSSTKLLVAEVDVCEKKILREILRNRAKVAIKGSIDKKTQRIGGEIREVALQILNDFKTQATQAGAEEFTGIATQAYREATNGEEFIDFLSFESGIPIRIISQDEEGALGYKGIAISGNRTLENTVVWDLGGSSMQVTYADGQEVKTFKTSFASVDMAKWMIIAQGKPEDASPNPVSLGDFTVGKQFVQQRFQPLVPEELKFILSQPEVRVVGIGGVWAKSITSQYNKVMGSELDGPISQDLLRDVMTRRLNQGDDQLGGGDFVDTDVTNFILCLGWMELFGIDPIHFSDAGILEALLFSE